MPALISTPQLLFYFPDESTASLTGRWEDWVSRDATVVTRKDQSEDSPGIMFELLRTTIRLRPALTSLVAIAEPRLHREKTAAAGALMFYPCLPWPFPQLLCVRVRESPDVLWAIPRELTVDDFD